MVGWERRRVVDPLEDRSTGTTADWFTQHPGSEIVSRDRADTYADAARQGAPQACGKQDPLDGVPQYVHEAIRIGSALTARIAASAAEM